MARQMSISVAKASDKTSIDHNNRTMNKSELNKLTHIDQSRLNKNEYLVNIPIQDLYEKEFGEALSNYNAKQKRNDRKIDKIIWTLYVKNRFYYSDNMTGEILRNYLLECTSIKPNE